MLHYWLSSCRRSLRNRTGHYDWNIKLYSFLGSFVGMSVAFFSLLASQANLMNLLGLGAVYLCTGTLESLVLIYFIGNSLGMSTFASLIVLIIATKEIGPIGLILGIPLAAIFKHLFLSFASVCQEQKII